MDESVSRIFVKFKTARGREVYWGMWFTRDSAIDWATEEMKLKNNQIADDPFIGYELVHTNVVTEQLSKRYGMDGR